MTVDAWVLEAVESAGSKGATVREVQRTIDEKHFEELAIDTIEASITGLLADGRLVGDAGRYHLAKRTSKRSEEHTSELQSLMRISYAVFCLKKKTTKTK